MLCTLFASILMWFGSTLCNQTLGANSTISNLTAGTSLDDADLLAYVDNSGTPTTKKITWANATSSLQTWFNGVYSPIFSTSAGLAGLLSDETGSGSSVFGTTPTLTSATMTTPHIDVSGTEAVGDILYLSGNGGTLSRLAIGSESSVLNVSSGIPSWSPLTSLSVTTLTVTGTTTMSATSTGVVKYFGDGSDGTVTLSAGTTTLTRDMYYENLTVPAGSALNPYGYKIYVANALVVSGIIDRTGNAGSNGTDGTTDGSVGTGGAGGVGTSSHSVYGSLNGVAGANGTAGSGGGGSCAGGTSGTAGLLAFNALGSSGATGGGGGAGANGGNGSGGAGGSVLLASSTIKTFPIIYQMFSADGLLTGNGSGGGGGGGGCSTTQHGAGGGGGGSGASGAFIWINAKNITVNSGGVIRANGGKGGNGGNGGGGGSNGGGGGGGGAGGSGGYVIIIYAALSNGGTIQASGGVGGSGGTGNAPGVDGSSGNTGTSGTVVYF